MNPFLKEFSSSKLERSWLEGRSGLRRFFFNWKYVKLFMYSVTRAGKGVDKCGKQ